ncbi:glycosyl hydrolase family 28-related protein [Streptomyces sp. NPDC048288]|uniref:glycosyl hydrolase family 28-related protein n=1 Tax=Streptomyces sp. NPDC048288 TaxID=3365529 RepID=UPI003721820D
MARHLFGGSPADYAAEKVGNQLLLRPDAEGTVWDSLTGGTQITDLTDTTGAPITTVTADTDGAVTFYGPDGVTSVYTDFGYGRRYVMAATDTGAALAAFIAEGGAPGGWAVLDGSGKVDPAQLTKQLDWAVATDAAYGATGNGTTDDTAALQAAVNAAAAAQKTLYIPKGTYIVSTPISIPAGEGMAIVGSGWGTSIKLKNSSNCYVFAMTAADTRITMRDMTIDGNCTGQGTTGSSGGINAAGAVASCFDNIHFTACRDDALYLGGQTGGAFGHNNRVIGCLFDQSMSSTGPGRGIHMDSSDENQILACDFEYLGGAGTNPAMVYDQAGTQFISDCNFVNGAHDVIGVKVQDTKSTKITGCNFDGLAGTAIFLAAQRCVVTSCTIFSVGHAGTAGAASGIHLEYATAGNIVSDNVITSDPTNGVSRTAIREASDGGSGGNIISENQIITTGTWSYAALDLSGKNSQVLGNVGGGRTGNQTTFINVKDYGAVGDGTTDDTAAIQAALNAVPANGATVLIPTATFKITSPLTASITGTELIGLGHASRILFDGSVATTAIQASGNIRLFVRDMRISQTNASHVGTAVDISNCNGAVVERLLIDAGGSGVAPLVGVKLNAATCHYNTVRECRINYGGTASAGVYLSGGSHSNIVQGCRLVPSGDDAASSGIYVGNAHSITLIHPDVENAAGNGIWLDTGADSATILNAYSEQNNINLKISSGVTAPTVIGGTYQTGTTANVQDNGALSAFILNAWPNSGGGNSYSRISLAGADKFSINGIQVPANMLMASDLGFAAFNYDPANTSNTTLTVSGTLYLARVTLRYATTISKLAVAIATAASGVTANQNFLALIDSTGTIRAATAAGAIDTALASSGLLNQAVVTPYAAPAGTYWVAFLNVATTPATLGRSSGLSLTIANGGLTASNYRFATNGSGLTALPGSITPGSNSLTNAFTMWAGVS